MLNVSVTITGDKETVKKLTGLGKDFADWTPELRKVGDFLQNFYENAVFESQGGVFAARWAALNPFYEFWKRKAFPGHGILERSGKMRHDWKQKVMPTYLVLANMTDYAKYHQSDKPRKSHLPRRIIIKMDQARKNEIVDIIKAGVVRKIGDAARAV